MIKNLRSFSTESHKWDRIGTREDKTLQCAIEEVGRRLRKINSGEVIENCPLFEECTGRMICIDDAVREVLDECEDEFDKLVIWKTWKKEIDKELYDAVIALCGLQMACSGVKSESRL